MLLTIDVGNTSTSFGLFDGSRLKRKWRVETVTLLQSMDTRFRGYDKCSDCEVIIASVAPKADPVLKKLFPKSVFVNHKNVGIRVKVKRPSEVGADRLVNALAAHTLYKGPLIVVDFGTAATFDVVSAKGEYLGGVIVPGIQMSADALHERTAKLPKITIKRPRSVIGKSTVEAIRSGIFYGYVSLVEGMIKRLQCQMLNAKCQINVIATGGYARFIAKYASGIDIIDPDLTLKGLNLIWLKS